MALLRCRDEGEVTLEYTNMLPWSVRCIRSVFVGCFFGMHAISSNLERSLGLERLLHGESSGETEPP